MSTNCKQSLKLLLLMNLQGYQLTIMNIYEHICIGSTNRYSLKMIIDNNFLTIGTFVELVTVLFMRIDLEAVWFWTTCLG